MDGAKLKNYIIILLAAVNLFLLSIVVMQRNETAEIKREALADIRAVFESRGIGIAPGVSLDFDTPSQYAMQTGPEQELSSVKRLLGDVTLEGSEAFFNYYSGEKGNATFRSSGFFEVTFGAELFPLAEDAVKQTLDILSLLGISGDAGAAKIIIDPSSPSVTTVRTNCMWRGLPVWRSDLSATFIGGSLYRVEGYRLLDIVTERSSGDALELVTILVRFLELIESSRSEVGEIQEIAQGYIVSNTAAGDSYLDPAWRIETDSGTFYLNGLTGKRMVVAEY